MTLQELNEYARLKRELDRTENLKASLKESAELGAQAFTGLPHAPGYRNKLGDVVPKILDDLPLIEEQIDGLREELLYRELIIDKFIADIPDLQTRHIFKLRFCGGFTWAWIANAIGGGNTADGVKKRCYRYLDSHA